MYDELERGIDHHVCIVSGTKRLVVLLCAVKPINGQEAIRGGLPGVIDRGFSRE